MKPIRETGPRAHQRPRRARLPPILEIDADGIPVCEHEGAWGHPRWSSDDDAAQGVQLDDWPSELDD